MEKPILFSTPMVNAILSGKKTQTRRIMPFCNQIDVEDLNEISFREMMNYPDNSFRAIFDTDDAPFSEKCKYGKVGDLLWVRESYCPKYYDNYSNAYKAQWNDIAAELIPEPKWKPSIYMPKSACRIWLQVTNIKVERLQQISEDDSIKEGIDSKFNKMFEKTMYLDYLTNTFNRVNPINSYKTLWESINGENSWLANPWVWVIEFKRVER